MNLRLNSKRFHHWHFVIFFTVAGLLLLHFMLRIQPNFLNAQMQREKKVAKVREQIRDKISESVRHNEYPQIIEFEDVNQSQKLTVHYTFDNEIQIQAEKLLKTYKPDYAAIVAMDATTGKILAMTSYTKDVAEGTNLAIRASYPAASVFKIVPASAAMDKPDLDPEIRIHYNGGNHTLYRRNVMSADVNRWTRFITLKEAFARSINAVFARLTFEKLSTEDLKDYSSRFYFNRSVETDFPIDISDAYIPEEKNYELAEVASGYNRINRLSPVHGAMMAASIAADGNMKKPYLVESLRDEKGKIFFQAEPEDVSKTLTPAGAEKVRELMGATVSRGTGRKSFRSLVRNRQFEEVELGGKTGSLMGEDPKGKVDWFVGYGIRGNEKISIAAITVNKQYWTVKAAYLAQTLFKQHFKEEIVQESYNKKIRNASR